MRSGARTISTEDDNKPCIMILINTDASVRVMTVTAITIMTDAAMTETVMVKTAILISVMFVRIIHGKQLVKREEPQNRILYL